jgi:hypothetical protein
MKKPVVFVVSLLLACPLNAADVKAPVAVPTTRPTTQPVPPLPFFFIGVWMQPAKELKKWKDRGINVVVTDKPKPDNSSRASYFAAAESAGVKVVIYPDPAGAANDLKNKSFLAWMQGDEPENWGHLQKSADGTFDLPGTTQTYCSIYNTLKQVSPTTPVYGNFNGMQLTSTRDKRDARKGIIRDDYKQFFCGSDWISGDWYVRSNGRGPERIADLQGKMIDMLLELSGGTKPAFAYIESCDIRITSAKNGAAPTANEMKAQAWIPVIHGAKGIVYFPLKIGGGFVWDATPPELATAMTELNGQLKKYEEYFLKGKRVKDAKLEAATWTLPDGSTLSASATFSGGDWTFKVDEKRKGVESVGVK